MIWSIIFTFLTRDPTTPLSLTKNKRLAIYTLWGREQGGSCNQVGAGTRWARERGGPGKKSGARNVVGPGTWTARERAGAANVVGPQVCSGAAYWCHVI